MGRRPRPPESGSENGSLVFEFTPPTSVGASEEKLSVPMPAQDRIIRGPFAALLILLSLLLGSAGAAAAGSDSRGPGARPGSSRPGAAAALLPSGPRNSLDDEASGEGAGASLPPSEPGIVTQALWAGPPAEAASAASSAVPRPAAANYRA